MNKEYNMSSSEMNAGYLELIVGPMYSGKTSRLVEVYNKCKFCNILVSVINHTIDNRYDEELLSTHDQIKIPCIKTERLMDLWLDESIINILTDSLDDISKIPRIQEKFKIRRSEVVLINEGQFFPDLKEFVDYLLKNEKKVYICGLDGDFERKKFGQILDLIPLCDKITKLTSLCSLCKDGTSGIFSMRLTKETEQTVVGSDNYIPVCRKCYESKHLSENS